MAVIVGIKKQLTGSAVTVVQLGGGIDRDEILVELVVLDTFDSNGIAVSVSIAVGTEVNHDLRRATCGDVDGGRGVVEYGVLQYHGTRCVTKEASPVAGLGVPRPGGPPIELSFTEVKVIGLELVPMATSVPSTEMSQDQAAEPHLPSPVDFTTVPGAMVLPRLFRHRPTAHSSTWLWLEKTASIAGNLA